LAWLGLAWLGLACLALPYVTLPCLGIRRDDKSSSIEIYLLRLSHVVPQLQRD